MLKGSRPGRRLETYSLAERHTVKLESDCRLEVAVIFRVRSRLTRQLCSCIWIFQIVDVYDFNFDAIRYGAPIDLRDTAEYSDEYPPARMRTFVALVGHRVQPIVPVGASRKSVARPPRRSSANLIKSQCR